MVRKLFLSGVAALLLFSTNSTAFSKEGLIVNIPGLGEVSLVYQGAVEADLAPARAAVAAEKYLAPAVRILGEPAFGIALVLREPGYSSSARAITQRQAGKKTWNIHLRVTTLDDPRTWTGVYDWWIGEAFPRVLSREQREGLCALISGNGKIPAKYFAMLEAEGPLDVDNDLKPRERAPSGPGAAEQWRDRLVATRTLVVWYWLNRDGAKSPADFASKKLPDLAEAWAQAKKAHRTDK